MAARPRVIIDCDPGHDDAMAILFAARHADVLGITTVSGNAPLAATTHNALATLQLLNLDIPVHAGAARPLVVPPRYATEAHGLTGLDGPALPELTRAAASADAVRFIVDTLRREDGVWLVPIGPLTNIALALRAAPDIAGRVAGISLMGGSATVGNVTPAAEFNLWADPHAAAMVFESDIPLRMCGLNLTHQFRVNTGTIEALHAIGNTAARFAADLFGFYVGSAEKRTGRKGAPLHDPCAVFALTHPHLLQGTQRVVRVEAEGKLTRGASVIDARGYPLDIAPNCLVYEHIDAEAAMRVLLDTVASYA